MTTKDKLQVLDLVNRMHLKELEDLRKQVKEKDEIIDILSDCVMEYIDKEKNL